MEASCREGAEERFQSSSRRSCRSSEENIYQMSYLIYCAGCKGPIRLSCVLWMLAAPLLALLEVTVMSGITIAYKMGAAATIIPTYNGNGLMLIAGVSAFAILFRYIINKAWGAVYAGRRVSNSEALQHPVRNSLMFAFTALRPAEFNSQALHFPIMALFLLFMPIVIIQFYPRILLPFA